VTDCPNSENPPSPLFYDNSDTASLSYSGAWSIDTVNGVPNSTIPTPFHATTESGASVSLSFTGGTAVMVKGMVGSENGLYSVVRCSFVFGPACNLNCSVVLGWINEHI
jgi:hypothetical protein